MLEVRHELKEIAFDSTHLNPSYLQKHKYFIFENNCSIALQFKSKEESILEKREENSNVPPTPMRE